MSVVSARISTSRYKLVEGISSSGHGRGDLILLAHHDTQVKVVNKAESFFSYTLKDLRDNI